MDVRKQLAGLRNWLPILIAAVLISAAAAYLVSGVLPKSYEAKATLIVGQSLSAVNPDFSQLEASQRLSKTYAEIATTRPLLQDVIDHLGLSGTTPDGLKSRVQVEAALDSTLLTISATDPNAATAAAIANELAAGLIKASPNLQGQEADIQEFVSNELRLTQAQIEATQAEIDRLVAVEDRTPEIETQQNVLTGRLTTLRGSYSSLLAFASNDASNLVTVVEPAIAPGGAISPRPLLNAALAGILTLLLVAGAIVIGTSFDRRLKDADAVTESLGLATLGGIPRMRAQKGRQEIYQLAMLLYPRSAAAEAYRTLRANLEFTSVDSPVRTLLVTSAKVGEGKTVTAANLAIAFAQAGQRVLLVDADLRRPGVHAIFNVRNDAGLSNLLRNDAVRWESVVQPSDQENLQLLTTGPLPPNPAELLGTIKMRLTLDRLRESHDVLIVDSPPLLVVADAAIISSFVDGTLLVVDAKATSRDAARDAREALSKAGARLLGVLLNGLPASGFSEYGDYYAADSTDQDLSRTVGRSQPGSVG